jgi:hypothetical protein
MSTTVPVIPQSISKETVASLKFPDAEVLQNADEIKKRRAELERALSLGNIEHGKVKIVFEDDDGYKQVETTVWGLTDKRVILKGSIHIPIQRIHIVKI